MTAVSPFDDALSDLRISGSVLVHEAYHAPFAIDIPDEGTLRAMLGAAKNTRVLPFHLVWRGAITIGRGARSRTHVSEREVAICPGGHPHRIGAGVGGLTTPLEAVLARKVRSGAKQGEVECICGVFTVGALPLNPLLAALPAMIKVAAHGEDARLLEHASNMLAVELADGRRQSFTTLRVLEVFFAEAIRRFQSKENQRPSWFRGLRDPKIGSALARVHEKPGHPWTVTQLAAEVAMSPSRFAARFREMVGQSVMAYVTDWRVHVACRALREEDITLVQVAESAGYQDVAAFGRAFRARVGQSPARWRATSRGAGRALP